MPESLQGHLLVASPDTPDPDFTEAVVLLIQHSPEQAVGVMLNRPTDTAVKELWESAFRKRCDCDRRVNSGGPVPGPLMAVHNCKPLSEIEILPGVHYAVTKKNLERLLRQADAEWKVFDSHSGWGPGQLEEQLAGGFWLTVPATVEHVFSDDARLWAEVLEQA